MKPLNNKHIIFFVSFIFMIVMFLLFKLNIENYSSQEASQKTEAISREAEITFQKLPVHVVIPETINFSSKTKILSPIFDVQKKEIKFGAPGKSTDRKQIYTYQLKHQSVLPISPPLSPFVSESIWAPMENKAIIRMGNLKYELYRGYGGAFLVQEAPDGVDTYWLYDWSKQTSPQFIDWKIQAVSWSPSGEKIAYIYQEKPRQYGLFIAHPDGSHAEKIANITGEGSQYKFRGDQNIIQLWDGSLSWSPKDNYIAFWHRFPGQLTIVDLEGNEKFSFMSKEIEIESMLWSPDGSSLLYSKILKQAKDNYELRLLAFVPPEDKIEEKLINNTLSIPASKCAWSILHQNLLYCSSLKEYGNKFYMIDIATKQVTPLVDLEAYHDGLFPDEDLFLSYTYASKDALYIQQRKEQLRREKIENLFLDLGDKRLYFTFFGVLYAIDLQ